MSTTITRPMVWDVYYHDDDTITMVMGITSDNRVHLRSIKKLTDYDNHFGYHGFDDGGLMSVTMDEFLRALSQSIIIKVINLQLPL
jgi:hypothetical protein